MNTDKRGEALFRHAELTRQIVGVFFQVYGELGYGFLESVYRTAMTIATLFPQSRAGMMLVT